MRVELRPGLVVQIDRADLALVTARRWRPHAKGYAVSGGGSNPVLLHRLIAGTPVGMETDHVNGDKLDCRRSNLRICTTSQNQAAKPMRNSSGFRGATFMRRYRRPWRAQITVDNVKYNLGNYDTPEEAARAYDAAAYDAWGEFASLNFP